MSDGNKTRPDSAPLDPLVAGLHFRGKLPHLKKVGTVYFVTFRLADSLPAHEIVRLKHERNLLLEQARAARSPLTWHEEEQLLAWYCDKVEALLAEPTGDRRAGRGCAETFPRSTLRTACVGGDAKSRSCGGLADGGAHIERHPAQLEIIHEQQGEPNLETHAQ